MNTLSPRSSDKLFVWAGGILFNLFTIVVQVVTLCYSSAKLLLKVLMQNIFNYKAVLDRRMAKDKGKTPTKNSASTSESLAVPSTRQLLYRP